MSAPAGPGEAIARRRHPSNGRCCSDSRRRPSLSSKDVIHSFSIPEMRIKQDATPGLSTPLWFQPTVTTAEMRERLDDDQY